MTDEATPGESAARAALSASYPTSVEALSRYVDILAMRGIEWGLMGPREGGKLWSRHVANSLALDDVIPEGVSVADVGSGAGLPGIPLAIVRPDLRVTLLEPLQRRAEFLSLAVDELALGDRVGVVRSRAEDYVSDRTPRFDVVTCRAVAPLSKLLGWTSPLFLPDGELLALKGQSAEAEIAKATKSLRSLRCVAEILELSVGPDVEGTRCVRVRRQ